MNERRRRSDGAFDCATATAALMSPPAQKACRRQGMKTGGHGDWSVCRTHHAAWANHVIISMLRYGYASGRIDSAADSRVSPNSDKLSDPCQWRTYDSRTSTQSCPRHQHHEVCVCVWCLMGELGEPVQLLSLRCSSTGATHC